MTDARKPRTVMIVMVAFKYDYEMCPREAIRIAKGMWGYPVKAAMHSKRQIAYVVQTDLTAAQMMARLKEPLSAGCVERAWAFTPGADIAANEPLDILTDKVAEAWKQVRRYNHGIPRRLHERIFERRQQHEDGRGETRTRILDQHPLHRGAA